MLIAQKNHQNLGLALSRTGGKLAADNDVPMAPMYLADPTPLFAHHKQDDGLTAVCCIYRTGSVRKSIISAWVRKPGGIPDGSTCAPQKLSDGKIELVHATKTAFKFYCEIFGRNKIPSFGHVSTIVQIQPCCTQSSYPPFQPDSLADEIPPWFGLVHEQTFYVGIPAEWKEPDGDVFRQQVLAVLELAEDVVECDNVVVAVERDRVLSKDFIKALLYVGFVTVPPTMLKPCNYVLLGQEL